MAHFQTRELLFLYLVSKGLYFPAFMIDSASGPDDGIFASGTPAPAPGYCEDDAETPSVTADAINVRSCKGACVRVQRKEIRKELFE